MENINTCRNFYRGICMENNYYVYAYLDPRKPGKYIYGEYTFDYEPFYIGKGHGKRFKSHLFESKQKYDTNKIKINKIKKIIRETGNNPHIIFLKENLSENDSLVLEVDAIKVIGRKDKNVGPLLNLTDGGEGVSGMKHTDSTLEKIRQACLGKKHSEEVKKKISEWLYKNSPQRGKKASLETVEKLRKSHLGYKCTEEHKRKMSESRTGIKHFGLCYYKFLNEDGQIIEWSAALDKFCEKYNLVRVSLQRTEKNDKFHRGWKIIEKKHYQEYIKNLKKRKFTEEHKRKIGEKSKLQVWTDERRKKISDSLKIAMAGEGNSFYGLHHTEETKELIRSKTSGEKNVRALVYIIKTPTGEIIEVKGLRDFCKKHGINRCSFKETLVTKKPMMKGKNKGWQILERRE